MVQKLRSILCKYKQMPLQVRALAWFFVCSFTQKAISTITTPIFTRIMDTTEYGQFNVFNSWLGIVTVFVSFNIYYSPYETGLIRFEEDRVLFSSSLQGLELVLCTVWGIIYYFIRDTVNGLLGLSTIQMILMIVIIWSTAVYNFWAAEQRVVYKYRNLVILTVLVAIFQPLIGILLALNLEDRVVGRILGIAVTNIALYTMLFFAQMKRGKRFFDSEYWTYALKFSIPLIPHYLSQIILMNSDRIMIDFFDSPSNAGIYSLAYAISMMLTIINSSFNQILSPFVFGKIKKNELGDITRITYACMGMIAVLNILVIALSPEIIRIFAPESYYDAIYVMPPLTLSVFFMFLYDQFVKFQFYNKKTKWISLVTAIGAIINIVLNYVLIPVFGYYAAGYTTLFGYIVYAGLHYLLMAKICKSEMGILPPYNWKKCLLYSISFMAIGLSFIPLYGNIVIRYLVIVVICIVLVIFMKKIIGTIKELMVIRKK